MEIKTKVEQSESSRETGGPGTRREICAVVWGKCSLLGKIQQHRVFIAKNLTSMLHKKESTSVIVNELLKNKRRIPQRSLIFVISLESSAQNQELGYPHIFPLFFIPASMSFENPKLILGFCKKFDIAHKVINFLSSIDQLLKYLCFPKSRVCRWEALMTLLITFRCPFYLRVRVKLVTETRRIPYEIHSHIGII